MLRSAAGEEEPRHGVLGVVRHPHQQGADGNLEKMKSLLYNIYCIAGEYFFLHYQVGKGQPQLLPVNVDPGPERSERARVLPPPPLHELPELLCVPGGVDDEHVEPAVANLVVQVDGLLHGGGTLAEAELRAQVEDVQVVQHGVALLDHVDKQVVVAALVLFLLSAEGKKQDTFYYTD